MKVRLMFDDIDSDKEQFLADLIYEVVDTIMSVFKDEKEVDK